MSSASIPNLDVAHNRQMIRKSLLGAMACILCIGAVVFLVMSSHTSAALALVCFVTLTAFNYFIGGRDVLHPGFLFCGSWSLAMTLYVLYPLNIDEISPMTALIFVGGATCLTIGCIIAKRSLGTRKVLFTETSYSRLGVRLLLLYCVIMFPLYVIDTVRIVGKPLFSPGFFIASKMIFTYKEGGQLYSNHLISSAPLFAIPTVWLLILERERKLLIVIGVLIAGFMSLLGGNRGTLLVLLSGCFVLVLFRQPSRTFRVLGLRLAILGLSAVLLMTVLALIVKKQTRGTEGLEVAATMTMEYVAGPLAAFNYQVAHPSLFSNQAWNIATPILRPLAKSGAIHVDLPPVNEDIVNIPFATNVFTIYKPYYHDLGPYGCLVVMFVVGFIYGLIFHAAVRGNQFGIYMMAAFTESLLMSIYHDPFNYRLINILIIVAYGTFYFLVLRRLPRFRFGTPSFAVQ